VDAPTIRPELWPESSAGPLPARIPPRHEPLVKRVFATLGFLADASRRRRTGRRALWLVVLALAGSGVALLLYPLYTHFYARQEQKTLVKQIDQYQGTQGIQAYRRERLTVGAALTRLDIPKLHIDVIVVEGTTGNALRAGAGHYVGTALPGDPGNMAIAGHRTGFGEPFRHLDELRPGDLIILDTPIGTYTYQVDPPFDGHDNPWITNPHDFSVIQPTPDAELTLTTCDPPHTSLNRMIVRARLIKSVLKT
jgi:sortase A